jgi:hypothetical protein
MAEKNYAILLTDKLNRDKPQEIKRRCEHVNRVGYAENVNQELSHLNRCVLGVEGSDWFQLFKTRYKELQHYKDPKSRKLSSDAVIGIEAVATMSHNMGDKIDIDAWVDASNNWMQEYFGKENVVHGVLHMDETTPHIHYFVTPVKAGRFMAYEIMGNRNDYRDRQTGYSKAVEHLGLRRGLKRGYRADHKEMTQMYITRQDITDLPEINDGEATEGYRKRMNEEHRGLQARIKYLEIEIKDYQITQDYVIDLEKEKDKLQNEVNKLKEEKDTLTIGGVSVKSLIAAVVHCTDRDGINEYIELFKVLEKRGDSYLKEMAEIEQNTNSIEDI